MPKISIIVPVYNVEKYLERCIDSILNQIFTDFELILVNDGSTDGSGVICDRYSKMDNRVKVIHKINGGLSDARNAGINIACGEYIGFVDGDDWIESEMYEVLYNLCIKYNADITTCKIKTCKGNTNTLGIKTLDIEEFTGAEAIEAMYRNKLSGYSACNKLYKKNVFNGILFPKGRIYEDASIIYRIYDNANKIVFQKSELYNYFKRDGSITSTSVSKKRLDIVYLYDELIPYIEKKHNKLLEYIRYMYYNSLRNIIVDIINEGSFNEKYEYIKVVSSIVRRNIKSINNNKYISIKHKILAIVIAYNPRLLLLIYRMRGGSKI